MQISYGNRFGNKKYCALFSFISVMFPQVVSMLVLLLLDCNVCTNVYTFNASFSGDFSQYYPIQNEFRDYSGELHFPDGNVHLNVDCYYFFLKKVK